MMGLKLASLAQGYSGVDGTTVQLLSAMLDRDCLPVVPAQGSVGASGDLAPLAHMAAAMIGVGQVTVGHEAMAAAAGLARVGLKPTTFAAKEGLALLNGTQFSTACALAGLFDAERTFQAALVTGALSTDAAKGSDTPFDPRIHALRRHPGQIEVAASLRALLAGSAIRESHRVGDDRIQDPYCLRCQPQVMGACLDTLRHAAAVLSTEANSVTDNPLVFADSDQALSGGNFHAEPVAFAADTLALAIAEIGALSERRIALLISGTVRPAGIPVAQSRSRFRLHDPAGHGCRAGLGKQAARLSSQRRFHPDLGQPGRSCLDGGTWRAASARDGGQCRQCHRHRAAGGGARLRLPGAAQVQCKARGGASLVARAGS